MATSPEDTEICDRGQGPAAAPRSPALPIDPSRDLPASPSQVYSRAWVPGICIVLFLLVVVVFGQTVRFNFVNYDDGLYVYENPQVAAGLTWEGGVWAFTHRHARNWHPLTWLSHMADAQIYGLEPGGHHATNIALHAATAILLFLVLMRMTGSLWPSAFAAALFAIHPQRAQSVAWVAERKDLLSGLFFMLTLAAYVYYVRRPFSVVRYLIVVALLALGLLCKPMLVTVPFVLLLLDWWPLGRFDLKEVTQLQAGESTRQGRLSRALVLLAEKIPLLVLVAVCCAATLWAQSDTIQEAAHVPLWERAANALTAYVAYLGQFFFPINLAAFYPQPHDASPAWKVAGALLILVAVSVAAIVSRRKCPYLLVGWLWFLGTLVPVIGLVQVGWQARADRYTYLTEIGLSIALAWGVADIVRSTRLPRWIWGLSAALVVGVLMGCAWRETSYWHDSESLWRHTLAVTSRNELANNNLGQALVEKGNIEEAMACYRKALELEPSYVLANYNLAGLLARQGKVDQAIAHYQKAIEVDPSFTMGHNNLGVTLLQLGRSDEAIAQFEKALEVEPDNFAPRSNLAAALAGQGKADEAIAQYKKALEANPQHVDSHHNLAAVLAAEGKIDEAIAHDKKALEIDPKYVPAHYGLAGVLAAQGKTDEAIAHYQEVLKLDPTFVAAHTNLGVILLEQGKTGEAIAHFEKALEIQPNYGLAHYNLGDALNRQGNVREAVSHWRQAARLLPNHIVILYRLAWVLATSPDESIRNGLKAVELADRAVQLSAGREPAALDALAAAYAETGQFPQAIRIAVQGLRLAEAQKNQALVAAIRERLGLYGAGIPYRESR